MKTKMTIALLSVAVLAMGIAVSYGGGELPAAEGKAVWQYISKDNPYTNWSLWPGHKGMYPGKSPHGAFLKLYANDVAIEAAKQGKPMPDGAILVKENYAKDKKTLAAITPMYKKKGFNPEAGDWFWAKYGPKGKVMASGKVQSCIDCHAARKAQDWIFTKTK